MSYDYFDASERGYLAAGPSIGGQCRLRRYLERHGKGSARIRFYCEEGYSEEPWQLARELERLPVPRDPLLAELLRELAWAARRADEIIILSDGC